MVDEKHSGRMRCRKCGRFATSATPCRTRASRRRAHDARQRAMFAALAPVEPAPELCQVEPVAQADASLDARQMNLFPRRTRKVASISEILGEDEP